MPSPQHLRTLALSVCGIAALGAASACAEEPIAAEAPAAARPAVLARVNETEVTADDLDAFLRFRGDEEREVDREAALRELTDQEALYQAALAAGIRAPAEEVEAAAVLWFGEAPPDDPLLRRQVEVFLTVQQLLATRLGAHEGISLLDLQRYYEAHMEEFEVDDRLRVLEILVDQRSEAEEIRSQLRPGDFRLFRQVARQRSKGLTAARGGELGVFEPGDLPQRFEETIFPLRVGEISPIFRSEHGFHLFLVEERTPRHAQKFYEVQPLIFRRLVSEAERDRLEAVVAQLRESASIEIFEVPSARMEKP